MPYPNHYHLKIDTWLSTISELPLNFLKPNQNIIIFFDYTRGKIIIFLYWPINEVRSGIIRGLGVTPLFRYLD